MWPYDGIPLQLGKLSEPELDDNLTQYFAGPRQGRAPFAGLSYQVRHDEPIPSEFAAHAASEIDDDPPKPQMTLSDRRNVGLMLFGSALVVALIAAGFALL